MRVGLKGYEVSAEERGDVVLTFVIDVSGSMSYENRLGLVKKALRLRSVHEGRDMSTIMTDALEAYLAKKRRPR